MAAYYPLSDDSEQNLLSSRRYQIREKIFSFADNFKIKDELGQPVFIVRSKLFSFRDKLLLEDMDGNGLIKIRQELFNLLSKFKILSASNDQELAIVKQKFTFLRPKFTIDSIYGHFALDGLDFLGRSFRLLKDDGLDFLGRSFKLLKDGKTVATVSKNFFSWSDSYGVDIFGDEDHAFILALVIILDQVIYDKN
uniref:Uncharacterized protein n=1 Tax=Panagrolaimus sp. ES5 TaxID=591445 RepID=A0AC34FRM1_9BILA